MAAVARWRGTGRARAGRRAGSLAGLVALVPGLVACSSLTGRGVDPATGATNPTPPAAVSAPADGSAPVTASASAVTSRSEPASTATRPRTAAAGTIVVTAAGAVLPDPVRTPGASDPRVTPATIHDTICRPGYTKTVRPPSDYTGQVKRAQLAGGYTFRGDRNPGDYEEDHLIPLELGGSPRAVANLWPEPYFSPQGARSKDHLENALHSLVCSGLISLGTAQRAIARNWWVAAGVYAVPVRPRVAAPRTSGPARTAGPATASADCTPGYSPCIPNGDTDVDCAGGSGNGPRYVHGPVEVTGSDPYGLDANHDGVGCENG